MKRLATAVAASMVATQFLLGCNLADASDPVKDRRYDCGIESLYTLLHLESRDITLEQLERSLPAPSASGYSLAELRDAARACGLQMTGAHIKPDVRAIDRPVLTFLKRGKHGHFIVLRPVGHTGKLAQILDPGFDPEVVDKSTVFNSSEWTGMALIPERPNWLARVAGASGLGVVSIFLLPWAITRLRRRQVQAV